MFLTYSLFSFCIVPLWLLLSCCHFFLRSKFRFEVHQKNKKLSTKTQTIQIQLLLDGSRIRLSLSSRNYNPWSPRLLHSTPRHQQQIRTEIGEEKYEIWETYTGIILSQKLIKLPVLNEQSHVDCIFAVQDPKLSSEIKALEKERTEILLT